MPRSESCLTDISEHPQLSAVLPPYALDGPIGLDTARMRRLTFWGCLNQDVEFRLTASESSTFDTAITGWAGNAALGGAAALKQAYLSQYEFIHTDSPRSTVHDNPRAIVDINTTAVRERVEAAGKLRDPKVWSKQLSTAIGSSLVKASWDHLVRHTNAREAVLDLAGVGLPALLEDMPHNPLEVGLAILAGEATLSGIRLLAISKTPPEHRCYSLFPAFHPDRAVIVSSLAHLMPVVRPLQSKKRSKLFFV